jgi:lysozyme
MEGRTGSPVCKGALWYDEYPPVPHDLPRQQLPDGWGDWTLWQYTDGKSGPEPRAAGTVGNFDRSVFKGTAEELRAAWPLNGAG